MSGFDGVVMIDAPAGAVLQHASIDNMGCADMAWLCADGDNGTEPIAVLFAWSNKDVNVTGANPSDWAHVGCIDYPNGTHQHVFGQVAKSVPAKKAQKAPKTKDRRAPLDSADAPDDNAP